jgi:hypothetical protein
LGIVFLWCSGFIIKLRSKFSLRWRWRTSKFLGCGAYFSLGAEKDSLTTTCLTLLILF